MTNNKKSIELTFSCQEDFESMTCTNRGKFCSACQKEVIDFTKMSSSDIQTIRTTKPEACGVFLMEQLDPNLHPISLPKVRSWAFLSSILVSLNVGSISAQTGIDMPREKIALNNVDSDETTENFQNNASITPKTTQNIEVAEITEIDRKDRKNRRYYKRYQRKKQRTWFWSYRFPFIIKKPTRTRMGVPRWL